jgi:choline-sulfatase
VSFVNPHDPMNPPEPYASRYDPADAVLPEDGFEVNDGLDPSFLRALTDDQSFWNPSRVVSERALRDGLTRARALIRHIDDAIGSIVDRLDADAVVCFTSDHGDYGGHRGLLRKVPWIPFEDLARVPLIVAAPDVAEPGVVDDGLVQNADMALTFLDYAGLTVRSEDFESQSLRPRLRGRPSPEDLDRTLFLSTNLGWPTVRRDRWKYILRGRLLDPGVALFDLEEDPGERVDLAPDPAYADLREELHAVLMAECFRGALDLDWDPALV